MAKAIIEIEITEWFYILRDMNETHPENVHLFDKFVLWRRKRK